MDIHTYGCGFVWDVQWEPPSVGMRGEKSAGPRLKNSTVAGSVAVIPPDPLPLLLCDRCWKV